jgi:DNA-binding transcriptional MerR regulator
MSQPKKSKSSAPLVFEPEPNTAYTLDVVVRLTGIASETILHYQEHGLIAPPAAKGRGARRFDDEALRTLRRIEHLRAHYAMNLRGLKLTLGLLEEVERLRADLRRKGLKG